MEKGDITKRKLLAHLHANMHTVRITSGKARQLKPIFLRLNFRVVAIYEIIQIG